MTRHMAQGLPLTILVLVAVALSGCISTGGDGSQRPQPGLSSEETPLENETGVLPERYVELIDYSGRLGTGVLVNTAAAAEDLVVENDDRFFLLEPAGEPVSLDVNLSWDDPQGLFDTLRVGVAWGCMGDICMGYDYVQGESPLNYVNQTMVSDQETWLFVFVPNSSPAPGLGLYARNDVDFVLQGELRSVEPTLDG